MKSKYFTFTRIIIFYLILCPILINGQNKTLKLISPNSKSKLFIDENYSISWLNNGADLVNIEYSLDGNYWENILTNISANEEIMSWKIPNRLFNSKIKIRITDSFSNEIYDSTYNWIKINSKVENVSLQKFSSQQKVLKILTLGNSITFDNRRDDLREVEDKYGYRYPLYQKLIDAGIKFDFIGSEHAGSNFLPTGYDDNGGFPGIHDHELANLLVTGKRNQPPNYNNVIITDGPYLNTYQPDIILLHIGTNDNQLSNGTDPGDVEDILDEVKRFEDSTGTEILVMLARIIDRVPNASYVHSLNDNVQNMALDRVNNPSNDAFPDKINMVDMEDGAIIIYIIDSFGTIGNGINGDMSDDLHPNDKGYLKMADVWFNAIFNSLPKLSAKIYLEGAYIGANEMRTDISLNIDFPKTQPFNVFPWFFEGTEKIESVPADIVDWVLVSLRDDLNDSSEIAKRAALLKKDGKIVDLDGVSNVGFVVEEGSYFVVIEHRNHLPIISSNRVLITP